MGSLKVNLCGTPLDNPIIPASGTFGYGYEYAERLLLQLPLRWHFRCWLQ